MPDKAWWAEPRELAGRNLAHTAEQLATSQAQLDREARYLHYAQLYANQEIKTLRDWGDYDGGLSGDTVSDPKWSYNLCKAGTDTLVSLIARTPRIEALANGGTREVRKRAEMLTRYLDGLFWMVKYRKLSRLRLRDALVFDIGFIRWMPYGSRLRAERRFPWQILWHEEDARDGDPTCVYDQMRLRTEVAIARYGIEDADVDRVKRAATNGRVWVDEAWQLPLEESGDDVKATDDVDPDRVPANGRHTVQCGGVTVLDEYWPHDYFPIKAQIWDERAAGWSGQGAVEQLVPYQSEIHRVLNTMRANHRMGAVLRVAMEHGSSIESQQISNEVASVMRFKKYAPQFFVPELRTNEFLGIAKEIYNQGLEVLGISEQSSSGRKEPGITAAVAIAELRDLQTARFRPKVEAFDETACDDADIAIGESRKLYEGNKELRIRAPGTQFLDEISWADVDMKEDVYIIRPKPTGSIPLESAGRRQYFEEQYGKGLINRLEYLEGIATADVLSSQTMELAPLRRVDRIIDGILDKGDYETPDEFIPPDLAISRGYQSIQRAEDEKVPQRKIDLLRQWVDDVARMKRRIVAGAGTSPAAQAQAEADRQAAAATVAAQGVPGANPAGPPMVPTAPGMAPAAPAAALPPGMPV